LTIFDYFSIAILIAAAAWFVAMTFSRGKLQLRE
jgi:hypothetical protein